MSGVRHELHLILIVFGTAVVFGLAVAILPTLGRTDPVEAEAAALYLKARDAEKQDRAKAVDLYAAINPEARQWHDRAKSQIARLKAEIAREPRKPSPEEQNAYDEYLEAWRAHAGDYDELIRRGEAFVLAHPRGELRPEVEARIAQARLSRRDRRVQEAEEAEAAVARCLERRDFGGAILAIEKVSERLRTELDVWPRLSARRDDAVEQAKLHYRKQIEESDRLVKQGLNDDARRLWYSTLRSLGDGKVPELADLYRAATLRSEEIRP
jgi:hypothetical protein